MIKPASDTPSYISSSIPSGDGLSSSERHSGSVDALQPVDAVDFTLTSKANRESETVSLGKAAGIIESGRIPVDKVLWKFESHEIFSSPPLPDGKGTVYIGRHDGMVMALKDGKELWSCDTGNPIPQSLSIDPDGETVYAGNSKGVIVALRNGKELWRFDTESELPVRICSGRDGRVYGATLDRNVFALKEGKVEWKFKTDGMLQDAPAVSQDGTVYAGDSEGNLYALKDGRKIWDYCAGAAIQYSPEVAPSGEVYVCALNKKIHALRDGKKLWECDIGVSFNSRPSLTPDGTLVAGSYEGDIVAVKGGKVAWRFPASGEASRSLTSPGPDGAILGGNHNGNVNILKDGQKIWGFDAKNGIRLAPVLSSSGTIYVACDIEHMSGGRRNVTGRIYALTDEDPKKFLRERAASEESDREKGPSIESEESWIIIDNVRLPKNSKADLF